MENKKSYTTVKTIEFQTTRPKGEIIIDCGDRWCAITKVLGVSTKETNFAFYAQIHLLILVEDWDMGDGKVHPNSRNKFSIKSYVEGEPLPEAGEVFLFNDLNKNFFGNF